jgi:branched-chain amino acid transport system permease protein
MKQLRTFAPFVVGVAVLAIFPFVFPNQAVTSVAIFTLLFAAAATGWNIFSGYSGYVSLGHAAYLGIGSYALALMCQKWNVAGGYAPFLLVPIAGLIAGAFALPLGWLALRVRRHAFVVVTLAIFNVLQLLAFNLESITNGSGGMFLPNPPWDADFFNMPFYYATLVLLFLALFVSWWVRHSKYGLGLLAIRDDEDRALGLGVKVGAIKLSAYLISAVIVGMVGALTVYFVGTVYPAFAFDPSYDVALVVMVFLGGSATFAGPLLGALLLEPVRNFLVLQFNNSYLDLMLFGGLFLAIILFLPEGVIPTLRKWRVNWRSAHKSRSPIHPPELSGVHSQPSTVLAEGGEEGMR